MDNLQSLNINIKQSSDDIMKGINLLRLGNNPIKIGEDEFDIIIDDGCHRYEETINFYENSIDKLKDNGIYIIEDILLSQRK